MSVNFFKKGLEKNECFNLEKNVGKGKEKNECLILKKKRVEKN